MQNHQYALSPRLEPGSPYNSLLQNNGRHQQQKPDMFSSNDRLQNFQGPQPPNSMLLPSSEINSRPVVLQRKRKQPMSRNRIAMNQPLKKVGQGQNMRQRFNKNGPRVNPNIDIKSNIMTGRRKHHFNHSLRNSRRKNAKLRHKEKSEAGLLGGLGQLFSNLWRSDDGPGGRDGNKDQVRWPDGDIEFFLKA